MIAPGACFRFGEPLSGFHVMRQKSGSFTIVGMLSSAVLACVVASFYLALAALTIAGPSEAAPPKRDRGGLAPRVNRPLPPAIKPLPLYPPTRVVPKGGPLVPYTSPTYRRLPGSPYTRPGIAGPNCRSGCGSRCQLVSCSGLNTSQCLSVRQRCRMSCRSRC